MTSSFSAKQAFCTSPTGGFNLMPEEQALAAHFLDDRRELILERGQALLHAQAFVAHAFQEARLGHDVEDGGADGGAQGIAAVGRAMRARHHVLRDFFDGDDGAEREAATDALGQRHDVGRHAVLLIGEQVARAAHARLHLVEDQHEAVLVAQLAKFLEEPDRRNADAAFAHDRLDQDRGRGRPDGGLDGFDIGRQLAEAFGLGAEAFEIFGIAGRGQGRHRAAMERAFEGQHFDALGMAAGPLIAARHLDRGFHRLEAGIAEKRASREGSGDQLVGQLFLRGNAEMVGDLPDLVGLIGQRLDQLGMGVAQRRHGDAGHQVEIFFAFVREQPGAFATLEDEVSGRGVIAKKGRCRRG